MDKKPRAEKILKALAEKYPGASTALKHENPFQLLIATILSAQCTDKQVNKVTPSLFKKYPEPEDLAKAQIGELEGYVRSTGFYHSKAKNIKACSEMLVKEYGSKVPDGMEELVRLPGVARKTANIVLGHGYNKAEGIAVDTHVKRLAFRLGLTKSKDPERIEKDLTGLYPRKDWIRISDLLISHGRETCTAKNPRCATCALRDLCPSAGLFE